jgi:hypothetical protein
MDFPALRNLEKLGAAKYSTIVMTPNAYMTDEAWAKVAVSLCLGIREMEVIRDYPNWWVVLTLDGSAMEAFHSNKIFVVKEEGDASDTKQPYDQSVAKSDKANIRHLLDSTRTKLGNVTQWELIGKGKCSTISQILQQGATGGMALRIFSHQNGLTWISLMTNKGYGLPNPKILSEVLFSMIQWERVQKRNLLSDA